MQTKSTTEVIRAGVEIEQWNSIGQRFLFNTMKYFGNGKWLAFVT